MEVTYFYRSKGVSFSIERVFEEVRKWIPSNIVQKEFYCSRNDHRNPATYLLNTLDARNAQSEINHITGAMHYLALGLPAKRTLITVHDLDFLKQRSGINKWIYRQLFFDRPLSKIQNIVAISEFTKRQLVEEINIPASKIKVIGDPAPTNFTFKPKEFNAEKPRILAFCHIHTKNFARAAKSLEGINCHLRVIGKLTDEYKAILKNANIEFSNDFNISASQILQEYADCDMLLFPSIFEGFGVPVLEAQLTGRPVITTHQASLEDVARDTARIVDAYDIASIKAGVKDVIESFDLRQELIEKGLENVKRFDAKNIATQYADLYDNMLQQS